MKLRLLILVLVLAFGSASSSHAQEDINSETFMYLLHEDNLTPGNLVTGELFAPIDLLPLDHIPLSQSDHIDRRLLMADIDPKGRYLYQIEMWGRNTHRDFLNGPTGAELVRIDLETTERQVIFDSTTVSDFELSPDGQRMVIFYHTGAYLSSRYNACIMELQTLQCDLSRLENIGVIQWLSNNTILVRTSGVEPFHLINLETSETQTLVFPDEWYLYWGSLIPETQYLIVGAKPRNMSVALDPVSFLSYDLSTDQVDLLPFDALSGYHTITRISFSPNSQFVIYASGARVTLVHFDSGALIHEFTAVHAAEWIDDQTLIIQRRSDEGGREIIRVDAASGEMKVLLTGEAALGWLLFP